MSTTSEMALFLDAQLLFYQTTAGHLLWLSLFCHIIRVVYWVKVSPAGFQSLSGTTFSRRALKILPMARPASPDWPLTTSAVRLWFWRLARATSTQGVEALDSFAVRGELSVSVLTMDSEEAYPHGNLDIASDFASYGNGLGDGRCISNIGTGQNKGDVETHLGND
ncbi:hypothetical protein B0J12DRAFT_70667 [Macrophomina phaseolina]|uniref:Uncharacterized protein n=1 Tax=Macrophomina phaseolina TaxID=35725 RepID=A0ABQ8GDA4_9PEZI|nr:hypothetical protein B0J12DRAFT_70667 [Macrophomina phaseolina]